MGYYEDEVITAVVEIDEYLDDGVHNDYKVQPLAQDAMRIVKVAEELGEAVQEFILWTGQNPRKGSDDEAEDRMLNELADVVWTGILAIQHFTKDASATESILLDKLITIREYMENFKNGKS
jgi:hypothetical protein